MRDHSRLRIYQSRCKKKKLNKDKRNHLVDMRNKTKRRQNRRLERESVAGRFSEERDRQVKLIQFGPTMMRMWTTCVVRVYIFSFFLDVLLLDI